MLSAPLRRSWPRPRGLKTRLLGAVLLLSVVPLSAVGVLVHRQGEALLQGELWNRLTAVALLKGQQIQAWVRERRNDVVRPASLETFQRRLATLVDRAGTADGAQAEREIRQILERLRATGESTEMFVIDPQRGQVLLSTDPGQEGKLKRDRPYFREGRKGPHVQHVYYSMVLERPVMAFSAPVVDPGGRLLAILVARVDLRILDRIMSEREGLGSTGQTFLVNRFNHFVSDSLGRGENGWRPVFSEGVTRALAGTSGTAAYVNHAGQRVVGAHRWIPEVGLALIAEMHEREGFAPIRASRVGLMVVVGLVAAVAVVVGAGLSYGIARPIARLGEAARVLGEGRVDQRVQVEGPAELAMLGRSFNAMADSLGALQSNLQRQATNRTQELTALNQLADLMAEAQTVDALLDQSLERLLPLLELEVGVAFLANARNDTLVLAAHRGLPPDVVSDLTGRPLAIDQGVVGEVATSGRLILLDEFSGDPRVLCSGVRNLGIRGFVGFPLRAKGRVLGVLGLGAYGTTAMPAERLTFLEALGHQLGAVIENLGLRERAMARSTRLRMLAEVDHVISSSLDPQVALRAVSAAARDLMAARLVAVWLADERTRTLTLFAVGSASPDLESLPVTTLPYGSRGSGWVAVHRRLLNIPDVLADDRLVAREWLEASGLRSMVGLPITLGDALVGVLTLYGKEPFPLDDGERELLESFAAQAAIAIRNAQLFASSERRREAAEALARVGHALARSLDHDVLAQQIVESVHTLFKAEMAVLYRFEPESGDLVLLAGFGPAVEWNPRLPRGTATVGRAVVERRPIVTADLLNDPDIRWTPETRARIERSEFRAVLAVPLVTGDRVIGALAVGDRLGRVFDEDDTRLAAAFADQATVALENNRLYQASERQRRSLATLVEISQRLTHGPDLPAVLGSIAEDAAQLVGGEAGFRLLEGEHLVRVGTTGGALRVMPRERLRVGESLSGWVAATGEPIITDDVAADPRLIPEHRQAFERTPTVAVMCAPIRLGDRMLGTLNVYRERGYRFDDEMVRIVMSFADQSAIAIENARLFAASERRAERLRALSTLTRLITAAAVDTHEVYDAVAQAATLLLGARMARVWVDDPAAAAFRVQGIFSVDPALVSEAARFATLALGRGVLEAVVRTREAVYTLDVQGDPRFVYHELTRKVGFHAAALVPLIARDDVLGVLAIFFDRRAPFTDEEMGLMRLLADQAAIVIEKSRLYEGARRALAELEAKNAELESFVYSVSHDLKAPLVAIQGMAGALVEDVGAQLDDRARHYLGRLQANVEQMERLIEDLLALSRIGRESRPAEAVNLAEVVDDVLAELAEPIRARGIKVVVRDAATVWGIRRQVEQVMANLLGNAVRYLGSAESPMVEVGAIDRGDFVECYVRDNGIGIDPAYHEKVFEIFERLHEIETEGTGVGLAIVKKVVEGAGGRVRVESAKGQGATFRFTWPAKPGRETWNGTGR